MSDTQVACGQLNWLYWFYGKFWWFYASRGMQWMNYMGRRATHGKSFLQILHDKFARGRDGMVSGYFGLRHLVQWLTTWRLCYLEISITLLCSGLTRNHPIPRICRVEFDETISHGSFRIRNILRRKINWASHWEKWPETGQWIVPYRWKIPKLVAEFLVSPLMIISSSN